MKKEACRNLPSPQQIDAILAFQPMLEDRKAKHSRWHTEKSVMPWCELSNEASQFLKALHDEGFVVGFDWGEWQNEAKAYFYSLEKLVSADLRTIQRLLTLHVRKDRFCEGHFAEMLENGRIADILEQLSVIRCEMEGGFVLDDRLVNTKNFGMPDGELPWEDVEAARRNRQLQKKHPVAEGKKKYLATASVCPGCQIPPDELSWFYFKSPPETWPSECGCAGWMVVCDQCHRQTDFFLEGIS
jgi:hypothetical protein